MTVFTSLVRRVHGTPRISCLLLLAVALATSAMLLTLRQTPSAIFSPAEDEHLVALQLWLKDLAALSRAHGNSYAVRRSGRQLQAQQAWARRWIALETVEPFLLREGYDLALPADYAPASTAEAPILVVFRQGEWAGNLHRLDLRLPWTEQLWHVRLSADQASIIAVPAESRPSP